MLGLTRDDLKPEGLQRRLKGGTVKTISVTPTLLADLRACLRTPTQIHVFGDPPPGQAVISVRFTRAFRAFGLHGVSHHTMRHTGVTDMLEDGVSPRAIQELAGWTSLRMLERYGHVRDAEMQRAVAGTAARNAAALAHAIAVPAAPSAMTIEKIRPQKRPHAKTQILVTGNPETKYPLSTKKKIDADPAAPPPRLRDGRQHGARGHRTGCQVPA